MNLKSKLYLLQLEEYDLKRYQNWIKNNPDREVIEKKGKINWTFKAKIIYCLALIFGLFAAVKIFSPFDFLIKCIFLSLAKIKLTLFHHNLITIGITGSWGKTTAKDRLAEILSLKYRVYKTLGNNNTLIGVALNVFKMKKGTQIFVCEMGAYQKGEIKQICDLVHPKIGIITAIGPMHLERFGSLEEIEKAKKELWNALPKNGLKIGPDDNLYAKIIEYFKLDKKTVKDQLEQIPSSVHRLELIKNNGVTIIDDTYNSNPQGFIAALQKLKELNCRPKILVTPGMIELGELQFKENEKVAEMAKKICSDIIFVGGTNKKAWEKGLKGFKNSFFAESLGEAQKILSSIIIPGSAVLFENDLPDHYF